MMRTILSLMRVKHYVKNLIIFLAPLLTHQLFIKHAFLRTLAGFMIFSFTASIVYIINDIKDAESDRRHPLKCKRPIASGKISSRSAVIIAGLLLAFILCLWATVNFESNYIVLPCIYMIANFLYSAYLKNIPLLDVLILVFCYTARLWYGAVLNNAEVSNWMFLTMMSASFFMGFGKRRNELQQYGDSSRKSLRGYTVNFLDKAMQLSMTSSIVFYSLMCSDMNTSVASSGVNLLWTTPFITVICLRYLMLVENNSCDGDPVSVILGDKILALLCSVYMCIVTILLYK